MYKIEYDIMMNEKKYFFIVSNESLTVLKRNTRKDILNFAKTKKLPYGEYEVTMTILYDEEYCDYDCFSIMIKEFDM